MYPHHQLLPRTRSNVTTPSAASSPAIRRGLYAYVGHRVVELLTEQQLVDHAVSVLPQLQSVTSRPHFHGPHWTTLRKKNGVDLFEFDPTAHAINSSSRHSLYASGPAPSTAPASSQATTTTSSLRHDTSASLSGLTHSFKSKLKLPNPGIDMAYAVVAQCELEGSVRDVVDALFNDDTAEYEGSMKALWGNKLKRGDLLLSRPVPGRSPTFTDSARSANYTVDLDDSLGRDPGHLTIKTASIGAGLNFNRKLLGAEKLCYTSFTQSTSVPNEAFHVVKTLPPDVHDQIACGKTHLALRDPGVDHIAVGYHLTGIDSVLGGRRTRLVVCAYASSVATTITSRASQAYWHPRMDTNVRHADSVGSDVRRVVMLLAKAARDFQQIVRQRRFGHQRFVYFPTDRQSCRAVEQSCIVCLRRFGLFRKDHYCQLCGHLVCRVCSKKHKVEPLGGRVRENRICFPCVARVDSSTFHDEQLWRNMDRAVVVDADVISPMGFEPILEADDDGHQSPGLCERQRYSTEMRPDELEVEDEGPGLDRSYGSSSSPSSDHSSVYREIQVAQDLFSPHPERRASALEALSRVVLETRNSIDHQQISGFSRTMDPVIIDKYMEETKSRASMNDRSTTSDRMQLFQVCYPRANPTATANVTPLLESVEQQRESLKLINRLSGAFIVDTAAFDSICEAVVQRLEFAMVLLIVQRRQGKPQIVGKHHVPELRRKVPNHYDLASYCPSGLAHDTKPVVVTEPMCDLRFRDYVLIHQARIRFFAEFPLVDIPTSGGGAVLGASLCVLDTTNRNHQVSKEELKTIQTLCAVASDLFSSMSH